MAVQRLGYADQAVDPSAALCALSPAEVAATIERYYPTLRGLVRGQVWRATGRRGDHLTEPPTALTHELCAALLDQRQPFRDPEHVLAVASVRCMHIVIDYLRRRGRAKRGGGDRGATLPNDVCDTQAEPGAWLLREGVEEALMTFTQKYPRQSAVLTLRVFMGRTIEETAASLGASCATVERDLRAARAYLRAMIGDGGSLHEGKADDRG
jgi:RNA polymerase sigma factor (TIGR02999 family)